VDPSANASASSDYVSSGFFVLRTPLLPIEEFLGLSSPAGEEREIHASVGGDRVLTRAQLRRWAERPEVKEALWLASPEFLQSLFLWRDDPESSKGRKLEQTLYRYMARMTARATPFGAFAGCSLGEIGRCTRLELGPRKLYRRATRLDMEYLCNLAETLSADPAQRGAIRFRRNSSLHLAAGKYHHVRGEWLEGDHVFQLVATDPTPALDATLLRAVSGATAGALASALVESDPEISPQEADAFMARLISSQLLVSELAPPATGVEPVNYMIEQFEQKSVSSESLRSVAEQLRALDRCGLGANLEAYDAIAKAVSRLGGEYKLGRLVQMDVIKPPAAVSLDQGLVNDILRAVETLHSIRADSSQTVFAAFQEQFQERYQDREVPLLEALDDEAGIGFENEDNPTAEPLIAGIDFRPAQAAPPQENAEGSENPGSPEKDAAGPVLTQRLEALRANHGMVLELDPELVEELKAPDPLPLPDAFSAMGACFRGNGAEEGFHLQSVSGPSGANLMARFCHADERLARCVQEHLRAEETLHHGGAVFAEIAHLPEGRVGNVICRPALRQYEIPYLASSGLPAQRQIVPSDLTVSLRAGRIVLRSRRLGCEVLPRLTSAHNFTHPRGLKLYKFLCLLQHQGACAELSWNWGALEQAASLPRVVMGNIVFSLARWRVNQDTAPELFEARETEPGDHRIDAWRKTNRVPRFTFIAEFDNHLLIDFENALSVETFLEHIRKRPETLLVEMFPAPGDLPVRGPEGSFVHEMILPFVRAKPRPVAMATVRGTSAARAELFANVVTPVLAPDSEWLFAKLYCSPSHADRLLLELVRPLVKEMTNGGGVPDWFFVRYGDPRWHLRLRFHGAPADLSAHLLPALLERAAPFQRQAILWRLELDTYEPEVERYGGSLGIGIAERLFQIDSELCLELMPLFSDDAGAELRWQLAFAGADRLLSGLGFSLTEKKTLAEQMRAAREQTWIVDEAYRKQLARKFRSGDLRRVLSSILGGGDSDADAVGGLLPAEAMAAFARFSQRLQPIGEELRTLAQAGQLTATIDDLATSFVHMHFNRMLRSCHLEQEAVLCDFLVRSYAARLAKETPPSL
jgi:thiopeptide-type bacteriocin biosynthesis protein